ncbi:MAG TPA: translocation/assembly module TamB domain-containing protein [Vicinamibacterales bacterium]|nr:translocation/assembly module TamB domain-containing protein [Vicinamibacterales bacterium]
MTEEQTPSTESQSPAGPAPVDAPRPRRRHPAIRLAALLVALVAALAAASLTLDLGPALRARAERAGSNYIDRPMHIGHLSVKLLSGTFIVQDLVIEGLHPTDRPFLRAKRIEVHMPWWTVFSRQLIIEGIEMSDWDMVVETFPDGRHSFPRFVHPSTKKGPKRFTTTLHQVIARRGRFTFDDHHTPWGVVAPNLTVTVYRGVNEYRGTAEFSDGSVAIQSYQPFRVDMFSRFKIDGGQVVFDRLGLRSTGAITNVTGSVDLGHWPEMLWNVRSRVDFPTQKGIFFENDRFTVAGYGDFTGTFHLYKGGHELKGTFTSPEAHVDGWRFPDVKGSLLWLPSTFAVTNVSTGLYGGHAVFSYTMGPFGQGRTARAVWDTRYDDVDLTAITDRLELKGIRLAGRARGHNRMEWPLGHFGEKSAQGDITVTAPPGTSPLGRELPANLIARVDQLPPEVGPFNAHAPVGHVPIAGSVAYALDPERITIPHGWVATDRTYVEFSGETAWGRQSHLPFHVTSLDWQESDRLLAGIMTAVGAPTGAVPVGGRGTFDGTMLESFTKPRIEGHFEADGVRAWDVRWGHARADIVIQNSYVFVTNGTIEAGASRMLADGKFSLGYPRHDDGEEINATIQMFRRPLVDLRHAFGLDDYPVDGTASGEYHLYGKYTTPFGFGRLVIDHGTAWGEPFDNAVASLRFEGTGVRLDGITIQKSAGRVTGAAWVGWDGTYSFNADATRIPVESLATLSFPRAPLSGLLQFTATGAGAFASPRYDVKVRVDDLFAGDEGIGQVTGRLSLRGQTMTLEVEAASPRLAVSGSGRIALTPEMDSELTLHFSQTSLDPYVRFFQPKLSPFTSAVADGTVRVVGELADMTHLTIDARVDQLKLKLFDYAAQNDGPIELAFNNDVVRVTRFRLAGEGTALELGGNINLRDASIALDASGNANLGILQGFFRDIRSSGHASLHADVRGPLDAPVFSGNATISDGRIRYVALPHSVESINGALAFDAQGIRLDNITAKVGGGDVRFGGRIGLKGYVPGQLNVTATGQQMHLRYPEGFRSTVDADLALRGDIGAPLLTGTVTVRDAVWTKRFEPDADLFNLGGGGPSVPGPVTSEPTLPLRFDIQIQAPSSLRVDNNLARLTASADLRLTGTYDRPQLLGRAEIDRGEILFEGNRYVVTRGTIDFLNPSRIEPFFDLEAEARVRVPDETYRVTVDVSGTTARPTLTLNSDPPLPTVDIVSLLLGQTANIQDAELRQLNPTTVTQSQEQLLRLAMSRVLVSPIAAPVTRAVEQLGFSSVQISPSLGTETDPLAPTARLIIGKRLSNRAYLTFSRALGSSQQNQIIILEYDQSDRAGWVLTQTGGNQFAIEFRVRHVF